MIAEEIIRKLELRPHIEGGWHRKTWKGPEMGGRSSGTAILFLLGAGERSHWHRVDADEIWLWHTEAPLVLSPGEDCARDLVLGPDVPGGELVQAEVPPEWRQSAQSFGEWTLVSCTVSPGFRFEGFELAPPGWDPPKGEPVWWAFRKLPNCAGHKNAMVGEPGFRYGWGMNDATPSPRPLPTTGDSLSGLLFALTAYLLWGFLPLYMKALAHVPPVEVIAHRVVWSMPVALAVLAWLGRTSELKAAIRSPRMLGMAAVTAALVSVNWGIYVWAIGSGHALDAALGYYINPLFSIFLGAVLLRERIGPWQGAAIVLAALAVAILTWDAGRLPLVALSLTVTWGFYAFFKKWLPIGPNQGFALEVLILLPLSLGYMAWLCGEGSGHFLQGVLLDNALLIGCGIVTAGPLMIYANGAKRLTLSTIAIMQYIAPTMIFLTAVFVFGEPFGSVKLLAFGLIWAALVIYSLPILVGQFRARGQGPGRLI